MAEAKPPVFDPITDLKAILAILTVAWLIWFGTGGPARYEASEQKPFLKEPTERVSGGIWQDPFISEQYGSLPSAPKEKFPPAKANSTFTPQTGPTYILKISKGQAGQRGNSYLKVEFPSFNTAPLDLSNLDVRGLFGHAVLAGKASDLLYQGRINEEKPVLIYPGSVFYIMEGSSPLGVSFRLNKCNGILSKFQTFYPLLPSSVISGQNYNDCVDAHQFDSDFYLNDWRIYLGDNERPWTETGDLVRIIDPSGHTISSLFY